MINITENAKTYIGYGVVAILLIALIFSVAGNVGQNKQMKGKQNLLDEITLEAEDNAIALEKSEAPKKKLSSYEAERTNYKSGSLSASNEIRIWQETKKKYDELSDDSEKRIRCQRAVLSGLEDWDCDDKDVFNSYVLHP